MDEMKAPGAVQLVRVDVATGTESVLHDFLDGTAGGYHAGLVFASDARWVIATLSDEAGAPPQVVRMDLRDGTITKLTNDLASYGGVTVAGAPSTSADGKILVFNKGGREIWRADLDGTHAVRLNEAVGSFARIAPDGSRVHYISARSGLQSSWVVDLAGGTPRQFSPMQASGYTVTSPDGRLVMFTSGSVESPGTFIVKVEGGEPEVVGESEKRAIEERDELALPP